jgi:hypothetical protein
MTQGIEQAIADLQAHLRYHERAAEKLRKCWRSFAISRAKWTVVPRRRRVSLLARRLRRNARRSRSARRPEKRPLGPGPLASLWLKWCGTCLNSTAKPARGGVKPKVVYEQVQQAGYRFGGKPDNQLHQLYRLPSLSKPSAFGSVATAFDFLWNVDK